MQAETMKNQQLVHQNEAFWEDHYQNKRTQSNGNPSGALVRYTEGLKSGRALELGCSHGDDAIWLAQRGWQVLGVDISPIALARAVENAAAKGVSDRIDFQRFDLSSAFPTGRFDLVTAFYLQSPIEMARDQILHQAACAVAVGGLLLIAEHASGPPWSEHKDVAFPHLEETLAALKLVENHWQKIFIGTPKREMTSPDGEKAILKDNVLVLKRLIVD